MAGCLHSEQEEITGQAAHAQRVAYPSQGHEMLFDAHTRSFQALGGVTRRGIYDNMKTAVDKVKKGKGRIVNARFAAMCSHYLFDPDFCNVASGWEKGVVEKNVQDSRRRIWIEAGTRRFGSFTELNAWLGERCRSIWADTQHPVHKQFTVAEMLELEKVHLMSMPAPFDGYVEKAARVSSTCLVSTRLYPNGVAVAADDVLVASHARLAGNGQTMYDWQHYIDLVQRKPGALRNGAPFLDLPAPLLRLRQSLLRPTGGDRVMARCWPPCPRPAWKPCWWPSNWCSKAPRRAAASAPSMCAMCWPGSRRQRCRSRPKPRLNGVRNILHSPARILSSRNATRWRISPFPKAVLDIRQQGCQSGTLMREVCSVRAKCEPLIS